MWPDIEIPANDQSKLFKLAHNWMSLVSTHQKVWFKSRHYSTLTHYDHHDAGLCPSLHNVDCSVDTGSSPAIMMSSELNLKLSSANLSLFPSLFITMLNAGIASSFGKPHWPLSSGALQVSLSCHLWAILTFGLSFCQNIFFPYGSGQRTSVYPVIGRLQVNK